MFAQQPQPQQPAVISLGEEYTDENLPASYIDFDDDQEYVEENDDDDYDEEDSDSPISPDSPPSPTASHSAFGFPSPPNSLWHFEHARLLNIHTTVLDNERASRNRELKLESEVARLKKDLAKLKHARAQASAPQVPATLSSASTASVQSGRESALPRAPGPRGPRPRPQERSAGNRAPTQSTQETASPSRISLAPPTLGKFEFELTQEDTVETVLSNHLTQVRSARAQERHKRKKEYERMRELSVLLTLGSEVRKWEERLAWSRFQASIASDDSTLDTTSKSMEIDTDPDPRGKRLSRSFSLPSRSSSSDPSEDRVPLSKNNNNNNTNNKRSGPPSPALPSLASSPLWRVSAEMILRRRSLSERPRRTPVLPATATPGTSREHHASANSVSSTPAPLSSTSSANGSTSGASSPTSGKRYSIPPPITIPSNSEFCSAKVLSVVTPVLSKTAPAKPSALKWAYTADDLAKDIEREMEESRKVQGSQQDAMDVDSASSSDDSESDDSGKSSSEGCSSSSSQAVERRGRARFSWRKSLPKEGNLNSTGICGGAQPMVIDP